MFKLFFILKTKRYDYESAKQIFLDHQSSISLINSETIYENQKNYPLVVIFPGTPTFDELCPVLEMVKKNFALGSEFNDFKADYIYDPRLIFHPIFIQ
jgi:hypothetical protein